MPDPQPFWFTREAIRAVDQRAAQDYAIPTIVLMENAARALASHVDSAARSRMMDPVLPIVFLIGPGNNGGDGLAAARHLSNNGWRVCLVAAFDLPPSHVAKSCRSDSETNLEIVRRMNLPMCVIPEASVRAVESSLPSDVLLSEVFVDCLLGTGATKAPMGRIARLIGWLNALHNRRPITVVSADLPSGFDADRGQPLGDPCVIADTTVTFGGLKIGFKNPESHRFTGRVVVADIGVPRALLAALSCPVPPAWRTDPNINQT